MCTYVGQFHHDRCTVQMIKFLITFNMVVHKSFYISVLVRPIEGIYPCNRLGMLASYWAGGTIMRCDRRKQRISVFDNYIL